VSAAWQVLRKMRSHHYRLTIDDERREVRTPLLFIGNNRYSLDPRHLGHRESLDDGRLSLCAVSAEGPVHLVKVALKVLVGLADADADFEDLTEARSIIVEGTGEIGVALDGEVVRMELPLALDILPSALGVVAPRAPAGREPLYSRTHSPH
jgi:diacylglycerol kinase family enzyme